MIYHLMTAEEWKSKSDGQYLATPDEMGFVHCCDERQLADVKAHFLPDEPEVVAVEIDPTLLSSETRYEEGVRGEPERFAHVYGPIEMSAVARIRLV
ncbi:MAG TPA: DUF952 domain-containing protein [Acidimicrobiales bacterium]|jgi:uncharacterized protein (DUF952 family)|nr:DUF952 domain-containing protein [Acidimicrobiales bacterium]